MNKKKLLAVAAVALVVLAYVPEVTLATINKVALWKKLKQYGIKESREDAARRLGASHGGNGRSFQVLGIDLPPNAPIGTWSNRLVLGMIEGDGTNWPVTPVTAKSKSSQHSEFVQGTLFYGIWRNHVVMHQSSGCRSAQFEDYLSWLLTEFEGSRRVDPIPKAVLLTLSDPVPPALLNRSRMPVKKVRVGTSVGEVETGASTSAKTSFQMSQKLWEHIAGIWSELHAPVPNFKIKPGSGLEDIRAYVELTCAKSKSEAAAGDVLAAFGDALRHSDTADYKLELADGTEITGDSLKKKKDVWFECHDRCPVAQQVFREIVVYFQDLVDSHTIVENEPFSGSK